VADQTIDVFRFAEVEARILPTIAGMATGAARLIGRQRNAIIIDGVDLAQIDLALAFDLLARAPCPVHGFHEVLRAILVALQARLGYFRPVLERTRNDGRVVHCGRCETGGKKQRHENKKGEQYASENHISLEPHMIPP
jgi:hypothetical protein